MSVLRWCGLSVPFLKILCVLFSFDIRKEYSLLTAWCVIIRWAHTLITTFSCNEWSSKSMYLHCYGQYKRKTVTPNLVYRYWALLHHLPTGTTVVPYAQHIIANHTVNKPPSVGTTEWNNVTKESSGKEPTNSILLQLTLFRHCITYHVFHWFQHLFVCYSM